MSKQFFSNNFLSKLSLPSSSSLNDGKEKRSCLFLTSFQRCRPTFDHHRQRRWTRQTQHRSVQPTFQYSLTYSMLQLPIATNFFHRRVAHHHSTVAAHLVTTHAHTHISQAWGLPPTSSSLSSCQHNYHQHWWNPSTVMTPRKMSNDQRVCKREKKKPSNQPPQLFLFKRKRRTDPLQQQRE